MREFASQKALISYAERKGLIYLWEGTPAFARRQRLLSRDKYELAEVRTSRRGVRPAMLFPKRSWKPSGRPMPRFARRWLSSVSGCEP